MKSNILCIVGPTATGKSEIAIELALKQDAEILNCDARQIYKRLNIGTNKIKLCEQKGIPHWGIDIIEPYENFTAKDYEGYALNKIQDIEQRGKKIIICGGTGLYLKVLEQGLDEIPVVPKEIRQELYSQWQEQGLEPLVQELKRKDFITYSTIDIKNPRRVLRALEVIRATQVPFSNFKKQTKKERDFSLQKVGILWQRSALYERINARVLKMLEEGLVQEVQMLLDSGLHESMQSLQTIGYKEVILYLKGIYSYNQMVEKIQQNTRHYAKRQLTWFRKDTSIQWLTPKEVLIHF
ncbi:MAG: tRNA (adenosine(37)-N6)-dimethylallyltransferase MiaA [Bacteroidia bacterium]|nr:tRNA (adenosine(37)-N6)-dimethylallyltransferase MiaA [Bacteroidia bacterium]MDW8159262.1 tRNA (adenosine(37)-N6)-dimethylallyltransferase MiaA [Bacteroidia bacterium]